MSLESDPEGPAPVDAAERPSPPTEAGFPAGEAWLRALVSSFEGLVLVCAPDYRVLYANDRAKAERGEGLVGARCHEAIHECAAPCAWCSMERVMAGEVVQHDVSLPPGDRWYHVVDSPIELPEGHRAKLSLMVDITERRRMEQQLRDGEERYRSLFEGMLSGCALAKVVWAEEGVPLDYRFLDVNPAFSEITGLARGEVVGHLLGAPTDASEASWHRALARVAVEGESVRFPVTSSVLGKTLEVLAFRPGPGQVAVTFTDVTAQRRAEEEQRRIEERLREAQRLESLGVLAGGIAHDFNNLLTGILGYANLARAELPAGSTARASLELVEVSARRAAELTRQLLAYAGRARTVVQRLDLSAVVEEAASLLTVSLPKTYALALDLAPSLPPVEGDAAQIRQVVTNLVTNAAEALLEGRGTVRLRTALVGSPPAVRASRGDSGRGTSVLVEVADAGCGMTDDVRARMFEPFFSTKFTGRGLGLAAVQGIVRTHGGRIEVESMPGRGTTVRVLLPSAEERSTAGHEEPLPPMSRRGCVLVADDEETVRTLLRALLTSAGYDVVAAADGREAVARFREGPTAFAAALLDVTMPGLDGGDALAEMRRLRTDLPAVLMSGYAEDAAPPGASGIGFLPKPFSRAELLAVLARATSSGD